MFRGATTTNRFVAPVFPGLTWLDRPILAKVNHQRTCNAFWNGATLNFFTTAVGGPGGYDCANTGEIAAVFLHEFGHGFDQNTNGNTVARGPKT